MIKRIKALLSSTMFISLITFASLIFVGVLGGIVCKFIAIGNSPCDLLSTGSSNDSLVAFLSMLATFLAAAASIFAACILWKTLAKLREANEIMREDQRAWLAFDARIAGKIERRRHLESGTPELRVRLEVDVANKGRLAAKEVICKYAVAVADKILLPSFEKANPANVEISNVIAPGSKSTIFLSIPVRWTGVERVAPSPSDQFLLGIKLFVTYDTGALKECVADTEFRLYRRGDDGDFPRITAASLPLNPKQVYIRQNDGPAT